MVTDPTDPMSTQDDPLLSSTFQQRYAAAHKWEEVGSEEGDLDEAVESFEESGLQAAAAEDGGGLERHKNKHHKKKKKRRKHHPCDYLEGLSTSVVRFGASPGQYTRATAGNNTCYEAVRSFPPVDSVQPPKTRHIHTCQPSGSAWLKLQLILVGSQPF
jgi:hypothetical protein